MNQQNIAPYRLAIFSSRNMAAGVPITPETYISHWIEGQHTTICFNILTVLFPAFCYCENNDARRTLSPLNYAILQGKLACIHTWNRVQLILLIISIVFRALGLFMIADVTTSDTFMPVLIGSVLGLIYMILCAVMVQSQVTSYGNIMLLLPQIGKNQPQGAIGGGFNQPIMQGQGVAVGGYA